MQNKTKNKKLFSKSHHLMLLVYTFLLLISHSLFAQEITRSFVNEELISLGGKWNHNQLAVRATGDPAKLLVGQKVWDDFVMTVEVKAGIHCQAGVIFRVNNAGSKIDEYDGYYIGIDTARDSIIWGAANHNWNEIAQKVSKIEAEQWYTIRVIARGNQFQAWVGNDQLMVNRFPTFDGIDHRFQSGRVGLRALGGDAEFRNLTINATNPIPPRQSYTNPVQANVADPAILKHNNTYYAYCTHSADHPLMKRGIRLYSSQNLVQWQDHGFVITEKQSWGTSRFWAPDIIEHQNQFYLYYATDTRICVAKSRHPTGPFKELPQSPMLPETVRIDAHVFQDDGKAYFYYVRFNQGNEIWGGELNDDMVSLKPNSLKRMIQADQPWERNQAAIAEGPAVLKHKDLYYLTYSGSHFESPHYAVGYATSKSPLGPWTKHLYNPIMKSTAYAHGTAHHCFTTSPDGEELFIVYHRHHDLTKTEPRQMAIDRVQFIPQPIGPDVLEIHGPTSSPQPIPSGAD